MNPGEEKLGSKEIAQAVMEVVEALIPLGTAIAIPGPVTARAEAIAKLARLEDEQLALALVEIRRATGGAEHVESARRAIEATIDLRISGLRSQEAKAQAEQTTALVGASTALVRATWGLFAATMLAAIAGVALAYTSCAS